MQLTFRRILPIDASDSKGKEEPSTAPLFFCSGLAEQTAKENPSDIALVVLKGHGFSRAAREARQFLGFGP
jgi:hypothetical protein